MDLWIRSQDKKLLMKSTELRYNQKKEDYSILAYDTKGDYRLLGIYKSKERALEVLNEIQELLMPKIVFKDEGRDYITPQGQIYKLNIKQPINTDMQQLSSYVYEMPEE